MTRRSFLKGLAAVAVVAQIQGFLPREKKPCAYVHSDGTTTELTRDQLNAALRSYGLEPREVEGYRLLTHVTRKVVTDGRTAIINVGPCRA